MELVILAKQERKRPLIHPSAVESVIDYKLWMCIRAKDRVLPKWKASRGEGKGWGLLPTSRKPPSRRKSRIFYSPSYLVLMDINTSQITRRKYITRVDQRLLSIFAVALFRTLGEWTQCWLLSDSHAVFTLTNFVNRRNHLRMFKSLLFLVTITQPLPL